MKRWEKLTGCGTYSNNIEYNNILVNKYFMHKVHNQQKSYGNNKDIL